MMTGKTAHSNGLKLCFIYNRPVLIREVERKGGWGERAAGDSSHFFFFADVHTWVGQRLSSAVCCCVPI